MADMPPGPRPALTVEQLAKATALYRDLLDLRAQGVKLVLVNNEDELGLRAIGQRRKVSGMTLA